MWCRGTLTSRVMGGLAPIEEWVDGDCRSGASRASLERVEVIRTLPVVATPSVRCAARACPATIPEAAEVFLAGHPYGLSRLRLQRRHDPRRFERMP